ATLKLMNALGFSLVGTFKPVASSTNPFKGRLIGNNKTIKNITLDESSGSMPLGIIRIISTAGSNYHNVGVHDLNPYSNSYTRLYLENIEFYSDWSLGSLVGFVQEDQSDTNNGAFATRFVGIYANKIGRASCR